MRQNSRMQKMEKSLEYGTLHLLRLKDVLKKMKEKACMV